MILPKLSLAWLGIVVAGKLIELLWFRRERRPRPFPEYDGAQAPAG